MTITHRQRTAAVSGAITYRIECGDCPGGIVVDDDGEPVELDSAQATARAIADHHCHGHGHGTNPRCTHDLEDDNDE